MLSINQKFYRAFRGLVAPRNRNSVRSLYRLFQFAIAALLLVFVVNVFTIGKSSFGEWGDFFGGVLNPLFTLLTFAGVLITIVLQQTELRESRAEMRRSADALQEQARGLQRQNFESTFFQMLSVHTSLVGAIDLINEEGRITQGRDCFNVFYTRLNKIYREQLGKANGKDTDKNVLRLSYKLFWKTHQVELGHYFRYLYNIVRFVKESPYSDGPYIRLLRAQLSDQETLLLFYNCVASEHGERFQALVEEFSLLDNMPQIRLLKKEHLQLIAPCALKSPSEH
ncbi:hypothetical protein BVZ31_04705 [Alcaligenes faecalis]|uniref:putative phage abortive infection protein n=1 Tax=Alcaligenes faecalis TaxID=511 RepID=UPI000A2D8761|nr:putative phage abortive infection protein [Alcaligenes faecalis]MBW4788829.1 putative phage abortive infection protein [Alcaligenes faecalis subsp. faecalis]OSZ43557.1 hypothetical protein BVZ30_09850 [Alcaligenes faecalis]OSZ51545.1 hypothetical protein BVZ31_04705 [Alcaligenes faecalis]OSZ55046.1 hypothetical protein BVZ32_00940 [Alcaligenes faecalis]